MNDTYNKIFILSVLFLCACLFVEVTTFSSKGTSANDGHHLESFSDILKTPVVLSFVFSIAFLSVFILVVFKCADCYNSEVSSENHPACDSREHKWGGAEGYTPVDSSNPHAGFRSGETFEMTPQQSLPYAMVPTQAPVAGGFQGFSSPGQSVGYSSSGFNHQGSVRSNSGYGAPSHYNPAETEEPPPAYESAARHGSLYGHR